MKLRKIRRWFSKRITDLRGMAYRRRMLCRLIDRRKAERITT